MYMYKRTMFIGFMLFALFFGAGNLIFPPTVGSLSGDHFTLAILGFVTTGVGLPLIGLIAGSFSEEGYSGEIKRIHPLFAIALMVAIYLTIGPFFAIPRTATVSYEMAVLPFTDIATNSFFNNLIIPIAEYLQNSFFDETSLVDIYNKVLLFLFSALYFAVVFYLSLNPSKIVDRVGQVLTPLLLLSMILLIIRAFFLLSEPLTAINPKYIEAPFLVGFFDGYQTMDTLAAVAFSFIVLKAVREAGVTDQKMVFKYACIAGVIAGVGLALVYLSLGWIGNHYGVDATQFAAQTQDRGTYILSGVAYLTYGTSGKLLLSVIVGLACLTTAIGLVVAVSTYFNELYSKISYKVYAIIFTLISFGLANQGLSQVIKGAEPILMLIYPITIVLIALVLIDNLFKPLSNLSLRLPIIITFIISVLTVSHFVINKIIINNIEFAEGFLFETNQLLKTLLTLFPFHSSSMEWMVPSVVAFILALIIGMFAPQKTATSVEATLK